jgi:hypothetical protein
MKSFKEYIKEKHNEEIDESFLRKAGTAALLAGALATGYKGVNRSLHDLNPLKSSANSLEDWDDEKDEMESHHKDLLIAAKKAGVPKSQWNNLKGQKVGGVVVSVNGRKVPLTPKEQQAVKWAENFSMR